MIRNLLITCLLLLIVIQAQAQENKIEVAEHGLSNGIRDSKQRDRDEAILDAKLKAIEKAGVNIKSITEVENYVLKKDWIESRSEAFLLPNFKIIDIGYGEDGVYHIVLVGKISTHNAVINNDEFNKKYRYAILIFDDNPQKGCDLLSHLIDKYSNNEHADDALWKIINYKYLNEGETQEVQELVKKMKSYYPESPFITKYYELDKMNYKKYTIAYEMFERDKQKGIKSFEKFQNTYPNSEFADDALWHILEYNYRIDGENKKVKELLKILRANYPQSDYIDKYNKLRMNYIPIRKFKKIK